MNSSNQNSKSSDPCTIPIVREFKEKYDNNKSKNTEKDFFKINRITKFYKCQSCEHVATSCPISFKNAINDGVLRKHLAW